MAFKNVIINGDMQVAQRNTSDTGITGSGYNTADRWRVEISSLGTWTQTVEAADAPANTEFRQSLKMNCTTADATPAAGDYALIQQRIEGLNLQHFMKGTTSARQFTLSFWVKTSTIGTYIAELFDHTTSANRHVAATYSVSAADTWEFKTITFPADTSGVLANTNGLALSVNFWMGSGTTYTSGTLATTWASVTNGNRANGLNVNLAGATNRYMQITGVQLEPGPVATEFEYLPIDVQFQRCLRYCYVLRRSSADTEYYFGGHDLNACTAIINFPVQMRSRPTSITVQNVGDWRVYQQNAGTAATPTSSTLSSSNLFTSILLFNGIAIGGIVRGSVIFAYQNTTSAVVIFNGAEL